jgi:hypothetical protein
MTSTDDWVLAATDEAMRRLLVHAEKVGLANTDECTLRAFFMAAAHDLLGVPQPRFQTEWRRYDLLVQVDDASTVIEFKYYMQRRNRGLRDEQLGFKGGPGLKNEAEFKACVQKLRTAQLPVGVDRRLVLVYLRESSSQSRHSFDRSYRDLKPDEDLADVQALTVGPLECRVLRPALSLPGEDATGRT